MGAHENKGLEEYGRLKRKRREEGVLKGCGAGEIGGKFTRILTISKLKGQKKEGDENARYGTWKVCTPSLPPPPYC